MIAACLDKATFPYGETQAYGRESAFPVPFKIVKKLMIIFAFSALFVSVPVYAQEEVPDSARRPSTRILTKNPCSDTAQGIERQVCLMDLRREGTTRVGQQLSRRDVRARLLMRGTVGRRVAALRERSRNQRSYLFVNKQTFRGRTEFRSAEERFRPLPTRRSRIREQAAERLRNRRRGLRARITSVARPANRKTIRAIPLCARRDGIRLIGCLLELGIEISRKTADEETLEIWERILKELR